MSQPITGFLLFLCGGNTVPNWRNIPTRKTNQGPHQNYEGSSTDHCHSQLSGPARQSSPWGFQHKHVFSGPNRAPGGSPKVLQGLQGFHMEHQRTEDNSTGLPTMGSLACSGCCRHHMSLRVSEPCRQGGQEAHPGAWPGADMLGRAAPSLTQGRGKLISMDGASGHPWGAGTLLGGVGEEHHVFLTQ